MGKRLILGGVVLLGLFGFCCTGLLTSGSKKPAATAPETEQEREARLKSEAKAEEKRNAENEDQRLKVAAWQAAQEYVKKHLAFPLDASFPWIDYTVRGVPETGLYLVVSTVEAKNAFGAELTYPWRANLKYDRVANQWSLVYLSIGEDVYYVDGMPAQSYLAAKAAEKRQAVQHEEVKQKEPPKPKVPEKPPFREWSDVSGKFKLHARFAGTAFGKVTLEREDGTTTQIAIEKLSEADREWIQSRR